MWGRRWWLLMQSPDREANANRCGNLSQPEHEEKLPEEASEFHIDTLGGYEQVTLADDRLDA